MSRRRFFFSTSGESGGELIDPATLPGRVLHLQPGTGLSITGKSGGTFGSWTCSTSFATVFDNDGQLAPNANLTAALNKMNGLQGISFNANTKQHISAACDSSNNSHLKIPAMPSPSSPANADDHDGLFTLMLVAKRNVLDADDTTAQGARRSIVMWPKEREFTVDKPTFGDGETTGAIQQNGIGLQGRWDQTDGKYYLNSSFGYSGSKYNLPQPAGGAALWDSTGFLQTTGNVLILQRAARSTDGGSSWDAFITVGTGMVTTQGVVSRGSTWAVDDEVSNSTSAEFAETNGGQTGERMYIGGNGGNLASEQVTDQATINGGAHAGSVELGCGLAMFEVLLWNSSGSTDSGRVVEYSDGQTGGLRIRSAGVTTPEYDLVMNPSKSITGVSNYLRNKYAIDTS